MAITIENTRFNTLIFIINIILSRLIKIIKIVKPVKTVTITKITKILRIIVVTRTLTRSSRIGNRALISVEGLGLSPI